jgi:RNA polymerase sigma-70 factor (ECF subfamily)
MVAATTPRLSQSGAAEYAAAGASLAFRDVYAEHFAFVWRSTRGLGVRDAALDDVVQEIFVVVHRRLPEFAQRSSLRTWISGITLNVVRRHRRTIQRKSPHELAKEDPPDVETLHAKDPDPYAAAARAEDTRLLERLLDQLDDEKREVLVLAELEEMPVPEIAEALGLKLNTAYSRLRLARQEFDQALARHRARDRWRSP